MTYAQFITKIRRLVRDFGVLTQDKWDGDGSTTAFRTAERPILENSYQVVIDSVQKTETTHYTLDRDTGVLTPTTAPSAGSDNVRIDYKYVFITDTEWLDIINDILYRWRNKIWKDHFDEATLDTVKDQDDYSLASISNNILWVEGLWFKKSSDVEWVEVNRDRNWKYLPDQNKINIRPTFSSSDYDLRLQYLTSPTLGTATSDTLDIDSKFLGALKLACQAEYWSIQANEKVRETTSKIKEETFIDPMRLVKHSLDLRMLAEAEINKVKLPFPAMNLAISHLGLRS